MSCRTIHLTRQGEEAINAWNTRPTATRTMDEEFRQEAEDLLRSAYQISDRVGYQTNWEGFKTKVGNFLKKYHNVKFPPPRLLDVSWPEEKDVDCHDRPSQTFREWRRGYNDALKDAKAAVAKAGFVSLPSVQDIKAVIVKTREEHDGYKELSHYLMDKIAEQLHNLLRRRENV